MTTLMTPPTPERQAALIAQLTDNERCVLWRFDGAEDGVWQVRHMSDETARLARRLARLGLCHRTTVRNERNHLAAQYERDSAATEALDAWDVAQAAREAVEAAERKAERKQEQEQPR